MIPRALVGVGALGASLLTACGAKKEAPQKVGTVVVDRRRPARSSRST
jgi:hypothetical protein